MGDNNLFSTYNESDVIKALTIAANALAKIAENQSRAIALQEKIITEQFK